jgi:hypothetical protein
LRREHGGGFLRTEMVKPGVMVIVMVEMGRPRRIRGFVWFRRRSVWVWFHDGLSLLCPPAECLLKVCGEMVYRHSRIESEDFSALVCREREREGVLY